MYLKKKKTKSTLEKEKNYLKNIQVLCSLYSKLNNKLLFKKRAQKKLIRLLLWRTYIYAFELINL